MTTPQKDEQPLTLVPLRSCITIAIVAAFAMMGCDRDGPQGHPQTSPEGAGVAVALRDGAELSPVQVVVRVNALRRSGHYSRIEPFLVPDDRTDVLTLIQSVDQLLSANSVLQTAIKEHLGSATAGPFDRSQAGNIIGPFSMDVVAHDERIRGDIATVTIEVGGRLPLEQVELVHRDGRWVIQTDQPRPSIAENLQRMAEVMTEVAREVRTKHLTAVQLRRELDLRISPIMRRVNAAAAAPLEP